MNQPVKSDYHPGIQREFTGKHMLLAMVAFFGVVVIANFTMAWFASHSWTGLVVKNGYVASQHYNEQLKLSGQQKARGWHSSMSFQGGEFRVQTIDKQGNPVTFDSIHIQFIRPLVDQKNAQSLSLDEKGQYSAKIELTEGLWDFVLVGEGSQTFHLEGRLYVNGKGRGRLQ